MRRGMRATTSTDSVIPSRMGIPTLCLTSLNRHAGARVLLVSCGAEEVLQGGIYGFAERHLRPLDRDRTFVINFDTVGSPELALLEGEGAFVIEDYFDRGLRDLCVQVAAEERIPIRRGMRATTSTDSLIRAGWASRPSA